MPSEQSFFKDTSVKWPRLRSASEQLIQRYPKSRQTLNEVASIACEAGDKATFLQLRKKIGKDVTENSWPKKTPLELCDAKYGYN